MEKYLMFLLCAGATGIVIAIDMAVVAICWDEVIKPIVRKIKKDRDRAAYWEEKYSNEMHENIKLRGYLNKLHIFDMRIFNNIVPGTVKAETSYVPESMYTKAIITFCLEGKPVEEV